MAYLDIEIDSLYVGRLAIGLFGKSAPKTVKNFLGICHGRYRSPNGTTLTYKSSPIDASYRRLLYAGLINGCNESVYGGEYTPEKPLLKHSRPFMLSMVAT